MSADGGAWCLYHILAQPDTSDLVSRFQALGIEYRDVTEPAGWLEIVIRTTKPIGGTYLGEERLFDVRWATDGHADDTFEQVIATTFGFRPTSTIYIGANRNKAEDHRVLGELALYFARIYGGVIDFDGALIPASSLSEDERTNATRVFDANRPDVAAARERFFATLDGKVVAVPYEIGNGRTWATHVADTEFMEAWLSHPDFHMIK